MHLEVTPLTPHAGADADSSLFNTLLAELGFATVADIHAWARSRNFVVLRAKHVLAETAGSAMEQTVDAGRRLLDLMGLKRGSGPRLLLAAAGQVDSNGQLQFSDGASLTPVYLGNLIGSISGESPKQLMRQWQAIEQDQRIPLWLRLYNEGMGDTRWDYQVFRCVNLLEGMANEVVAEGMTVLDGQGQPRLQPNGRPYTSKQLRGKVALLLQLAGAHPILKSSQIIRQPNEAALDDDAWKHLALWVAIRNRVAHTGSWEWPAGAIPDNTWVEQDRQMQDLEGGRDLVRIVIRQCVETVLTRALNGGLLDLGLGH